MTVVDPWSRTFAGIMVHWRPPMRIETKRWNDPIEPDDGHRLLICRYRPRGVLKSEETWDAWQPNLGPSRELHADYYGKHGTPIDWRQYEKRYRTEMHAQSPT